MPKRVLSDAARFKIKQEKRAYTSYLASLELGQDEKTEERVPGSQALRDKVKPTIQIDTLDQNNRLHQSSKFLSELMGTPIISDDNKLIASWLQYGVAPRSLTLKPPVI